MATTMKTLAVGDCVWEIPPSEKPGMLVPARIYASEALLARMDEGVFEQVTNVACLPGIVRAALCMPDGHWGYGFPIGGVAAFRAGTGVISPGGLRLGHPPPRNPGSPAGRHPRPGGRARLRGDRAGSGARDGALRLARLRPSGGHRLPPALRPGDGRVRHHRPRPRAPLRAVPLAGG